MPMLILNVDEIKSAVNLSEAIPVVEKAFQAYSRKEAMVPSVMHLDFPRFGGEVHVKAAHLHPDQEYVIKVASGFLSNRKKNLPYASGLMLVLSAETGFPLAILVDNAWLTDLRTAAAGAVAAKHMAANTVEQVGVLGAGVQGRFQIEALACVRSFRRLVIYDHKQENVQRYIAEMKPRISAEIIAASNPQDAVRGSRILICATPSREPLVNGEWVEPGTHITAMGSDDAGKQELQTNVLGKADRIIADSIVQCVRYGEIHHAIADGTIQESDVDGELGDIIDGRIPGRRSEEEITVCDLTGVGVQDAAIAGLVYRRAAEKGAGKKIDI